MSVIDKNLQVIKKIHAGADGTCYAAILRTWDLDNKPFTKRNWDRKEEIMNFLAKGSAVEDISDTMQLSVDTINKHIKEYNRITERTLFPATVNEDMYDRLFTAKAFYKQCKTLIEQHVNDTYFSLNSFYRPKKASVDVRHINAIVLDFDYYKLPQYRSLAPDIFYQRKIKCRLPMEPTAVIDSGRGIYVIYSFKHCSYHMQYLYKSIGKAFYQRFQGYGMDERALNITQVIRLPGSINTKTGRQVSVLEYHETNYRLQDFTGLLPFQHTEVAEFKSQRHLHNKKKRFIDNNVKRKPYLREFIEDLKKLILIRNRKGIYDGYRETLIYLLRERATWSGYTIYESVELAKECNSLFHEPLSDQMIEKQCRPSSGRLKSSIPTIIEKLKIEIEEQIELKVLKQDYLKKSQYAKKQRKHKLLNISSKKYEQLKRRTRICELKNTRHLSNKQIADILQVNKSTVTRDLQYIRQHPSQFKIKLQHYMKQLERVKGSKEFQLTLTYKVQKQLLNWLKSGQTALEYLVREIGVAEI